HGCRRQFWFFFASRRGHTRLVSDWSSDVCSSDLREAAAAHRDHFRRGQADRADAMGRVIFIQPAQRRVETLRELRCVVRLARERSEERRVGKECRSGWTPDREKKKDNQGEGRLIE